MLRNGTPANSIAAYQVEKGAISSAGAPVAEQ
jgi:hypothetical protein